jgi:hypothetical protein
MLKLILSLAVLLGALMGSGEQLHACVTEGIGVLQIITVDGTCEVYETLDETPDETEILLTGQVTSEADGATLSSVRRGGESD